MMKSVAVAILAFCLVVGCSGKSTGGISDGGSSGEGGSGSTAQSCTDRATQDCARLMTCSPERIQVDYGDQPTCVTRLTDNCTNSVASPGTGNTAASIEACAQAYATWDCSDFLDAKNVPSACVQVTGSVATGAPCVAPGQCTTGFCAIAPGTSCGVCAAAPAAGDSCAALTACAQGMVCTTDTFTCVVLGGMGATCGTGAPCGALYSCVGANDTKNITGTCQLSVTTSGMACDPTTQTGPGCDHNSLLACNTQTKECATLTVAAAGQPCGTNDVDDQTALCAARGLCTGSSTGVPGTCTAAVADEAACSTATGSAPCLEEARCILASDAGTTGTCKQLDPTGCP
jgi:hypothetical protein